MTTTLYDQLERRILLLDGGFGTMVQGYGLQEEDYRGRRFAGWPVQLKGCNDLLALTRPDVVREIHEKYLRAGADIIETDSFNANAVSLADYRLGRRVHGPQPAEAAFRGGIGGSHEPHGLDVGRRTESRGPRGDLRTTGRSVYGSGAGTGGRRG